MRAISFDADRAELIANGVTKLFTRRYRTPYRGMLAIHEKGRRIIAVAQLVDVLDSHHPDWQRLAGDHVTVEHLTTMQAHEPAMERWVHVLADIRRVDPVECVGKGGGAWEVPAALADVLRPRATRR